MVGTGNRTLSCSVSIDVDPIPGEVWINKDLDGYVFSNDEIIIFAAYAYKWLEKTERLDNITWRLSPGDIEKVTTCSYTSQMAIAIDTSRLDLNNDDCPSDPCEFSLTLQGENSWTIEDSITFFVYKPPSCTFTAHAIDDVEPFESLKTEFAMTVDCGEGDTVYTYEVYVEYEDRFGNNKGYLVDK